MKLYFGRRIPNVAPAGKAYHREPVRYKRIAYIHGVPTIHVLLIGPAYIAITTGKGAK